MKKRKKVKLVFNIFANRRRFGDWCIESDLEASAVKFAQSLVCIRLAYMSCCAVWVLATLVEGMDKCSTILVSPSPPLLLFGRSGCSMVAFCVGFAVEDFLTPSSVLLFFFDRAVAPIFSEPPAPAAILSAVALAAQPPPGARNSSSGFLRNLAGTQHF